MESDSDNDDSSCNNRFKKLNLVLKEQRRKIQSLQNLINRKDEKIQEISVILDVQSNELKRIEKSHRLLTDILNEERRHYILEKQKFCEEVLKCKRKIVELQTSHKLGSTFTDFIQIHKSFDVQHIKTYANNNLCLEVSALKRENEKLRSIIESSDEKNHELCQRYLRMQEKKQMVWEKLKEVDEDFINSLKNLMTKFNDLREEYNLIFNDETLLNKSNNSNKYLIMAQSNCYLAYENSCLKLELQSLRTDINKQIYSPSGWKNCIETANVAVQCTSETINMI